MDNSHIFRRYFIYTILVIGTESSSESGITSALTKADFDVKEITRGYEALGLIGGSVPDLAIIDLESPLMNSWEACVYLHDNYSMPVILLGRAPGERVWEKAFEAGADYYIEEPCSKVVLVAKIKAILRRYNRG